MRDWAGLEEFVAVAEAESFTRAARRLGVSTSQVSREIARLEERTRTPLLHRTTRQVRLTDAGRAFLERCRHLIEARELAFSELADRRSGVNGHIRLTCATTYGERFVVPIVNAFARAHPRISVEIDLTNRLVDLTADGVDVGVRLGRVGDPRLVAKQWSTRAQFLCASPDYLGQQGAPQSISDLDQHNCLLGSSEDWKFRHAQEDIHYKPRSRWRCNSGNALRDAALQGLGICQLPDYYVAKDLDAGRLVEILRPNRPSIEKIWIVTPQYGERLTRVQTLVDFLLRHAPGKEHKSAA